ncbi:hypothetical protein HY68_36850 [Streptomyces sp. AcH 505]|uniref:hypothetical protein n=1 Tax=Streptomyces sp. AcH 505 TaxID=352211 RepID=UPI000591C31F|nr:hypothetical protein HY68_36850 [Streptomyces sp. AcH 505]
MKTMTARQCADAWGISYGRARAILGTLEPVGRDITTGAKLYEQDAAETARSAMPGQGKRTDLKR